MPLSVCLVADVTTRFDQVFWFGDFNFRLGHERASVDTIIKSTSGDHMDALMEHDQLSKEMKDGRFSCISCGVGR